jgi:queuine tRNA-ribosyltransferase
MAFEILNTDKDCHARRGLIKTRRGNVETPIFMPVGTSGSVKALTMNQLEQMGAQIILGNTYHLFIRPGLEVIKKMGSLHQFISWPKPILTDSGGFQIFSIKGNSKVSEAGVQFKSHLDGTDFFFSPEDVVDIQNTLDSDIQMVLDNFAGYPASPDEDRKAMEITHKWAERARQHFLRTNQNKNLQFGILQGGLNPDFRQESMEVLKNMDFEGYALGGLSIGESREEFEKIISLIGPLLPENKPRYVMGSGTPEEILLAVEKGVDMFDCVLPTRNARNGALFTSRGKLTIKNALYKMDPNPLDSSCTCYTCSHFTRAYLRHLFISNDINSSILNSIHNVHFYLDFMSKIRYAISLNKFKDFKRNFLSEYKKGV